MAAIYRNMLSLKSLLNKTSLIKGKMAMKYEEELFGIQCLPSIIVAMMLAGSASVASAAPRTFVSTAGSDVNNTSCSAVSPCRTFSQALSVTDNNGEVVILTSGGYGPVTITKSVQINAPSGVHAAITVASGDGITIDDSGSASPGTATVVLSGLTLLGGGTATNGVNVISAMTVELSNLSISGFQNGIQGVIPSPSSTPPHPTVSVDQAFVEGSSNAAIVIGAASGSVGSVSATISKSRLLRNVTSVLAKGGSRVAVANNIITNTNTAIRATSNTGNTAVALVNNGIAHISVAGVSVDTVSGSSMVYMTGNGFGNLASTATLFVEASACAPQSATPPGNGTCVIYSASDNDITIAGGTTESPTGAVVPAGSFK